MNNHSVHSQDTDARVSHVWTSIPLAGFWEHVATTSHGDSGIVEMTPRDLVPRGSQPGRPGHFLPSGRISWRRLEASIPSVESGTCALEGVSCSWRVTLRRDHCRWTSHRADTMIVTGSKDQHDQSVECQETRDVSTRSLLTTNIVSQSPL